MDENGLEADVEENSVVRGLDESGEKVHEKEETNHGRRKDLEDHERYECHETNAEHEEHEDKEREPKVTLMATAPRKFDDAGTLQSAQLRRVIHEAAESLLSHCRAFQAGKSPENPTASLPESPMNGGNRLQQALAPSVRKRDIVKTARVFHVLSRAFTHLATGNKAPSTETEATKIIHSGAKGFVNQRQLYYEDVTLFGGRQTVLDGTLAWLTRALGCDREALGIRPSSKGLVYAVSEKALNLTLGHERGLIEEGHAVAGGGNGIADVGNSIREEKRVIDRGDSLDPGPGNTNGASSENNANDGPTPANARTASTVKITRGFPAPRQPHLIPHAGEIVRKAIFCCFIWQWCLAPQPDSPTA